MEDFIGMLNDDIGDIELLATIQTWEQYVEFLVSLCADGLALLGARIPADTLTMSRSNISMGLLEGLI